MKPIWSLARWLLLFRTPTKISRIRSGYLKQPELFKTMPSHRCADFPEQVVTNHIRRLMEYPGTFAGGGFRRAKVQLVAVKAYAGSPLLAPFTISKSICPMWKRAWPRFSAAIKALSLRATPLSKRRRSVFYCRQRQHSQNDFRVAPREDAYRRVMIVGGGNIGYKLAKALEVSIY